MSDRLPTPIALTIAGSDPSGGAGLQADLKTFHQHQVYGMAVVSLLTVQPTLRVARVEVRCTACRVSWWACCSTRARARSACMRMASRSRA